MYYVFYIHMYLLLFFKKIECSTQLVTNINVNLISRFLVKTKIVLYVFLCNFIIVSIKLFINIIVLIRIYT